MPDVGKQKLLPENVSLWNKDYFLFKNQKSWEESPKLPKELKTESLFQEELPP